MGGGQENEESLKKEKGPSDMAAWDSPLPPAKPNTYTNIPCEEYSHGKMKVVVLDLGAMWCETAKAC